MTPQQALTIIEASVKEACPEIMELSMGCSVRVNYGDVAVYMKIIGRNYAGNYLLNPGVIVANTTTVKKKDITEILGHDITLEHVLKAVVKNGIPSKEDTEPKENYWNIWIRLTSVLWTYGKPLHEQSDPCKLFLAEILGK